jgi:hypothetical protein
METTTTQSVSSISSLPNQPVQAPDDRASQASSPLATPAAYSVLIQGAQRACELEPTVRVQCVRSSHAPDSKRSDSAALDLMDWEVEDTIAPGAEVWQELVRMLVAREAAKLLHPARSGRA